MSHKIHSIPDELMAPPPVSDLPLDEPPPRAAEIIPAPEAADGGLENIPEEFLAPDQQMEDEIDHAGLDQQLPGEDRAHEPRAGDRRG